MTPRLKKFQKNRKMGARRSGPFGAFRKRVCQFCTNKSKTIDYKDSKLLEHFVKDRGRIISPRGTGNCAKHQRDITEAVKKARFLALLPYARV